MSERQLEALRQTMKPEYINRIDDVIIFRKMSKENIMNICDLIVINLAKRLNEQNINIAVSEKAKEYIAEQGFNSEYGARPLRRSVQKLIEDKLSDEILRGSIAIGDKVNIDFKEDKLVFEKE